MKISQDHPLIELDRAESIRYIDDTAFEAEVLEQAKKIRNRTGRLVEIRQFETGYVIDTYPRNNAR